MKLQILSAFYLPFYLKKQPYTLAKHFERLRRKPLNVANFDFYFSTAVYSSIIEGNPIDASSYWRYKESGMNTSNKSFKEIQDLISAFADGNGPNGEAIRKWFLVQKLGKTA